MNQANPFRIRQTRFKAGQPDLKPASWLPSRLGCKLGLNTQTIVPKHDTERINYNPQYGYELNTCNHHLPNHYRRVLLTEAQNVFQPAWTAHPMDFKTLQYVAWPVWTNSNHSQSATQLMAATILPATILPATPFSTIISACILVEACILGTCSLFPPALLAKSSVSANNVPKPNTTKPQCKQAWLSLWPMPRNYHNRSNRHVKWQPRKGRQSVNWDQTATLHTQCLQCFFSYTLLNADRTPCDGNSKQGNSATDHRQEEETEGKESDTTFNPSSFPLHTLTHYQAGSATQLQTQSLTLFNLLSADLSLSSTLLRSLRQHTYSKPT